MKATLSEVAARAGVSVATASRVFSRPELVNVQTAARVRRAASEVGYLAGLQASSSSVIGVVCREVNNPGNAAILRGILDEAHSIGASVMLSQPGWDLNDESRELTRLGASVHGLILIDPLIRERQLRQMAAERPLVVVNRLVPAIVSVVHDIPRGMRRTVEHLAGLGHQKIMYFTAGKPNMNESLRWRYLQEIASEHGLEVLRSSITPQPDMIPRMLRDLSREGSTAIVTRDDMLAANVLRGIDRLGYRVPDVVSVVGLGNFAVSDLTSPRLTTVAIPHALLGAVAVRTLNETPVGLNPDVRPVVLPVKLVVRESTGPAKHRA